MAGDDMDLGSLLDARSEARDDLRRVLIRDQDDRDAIASNLVRYRDGGSDDWADIIDMLTLHPEERRKVARLLGEMEAEVHRNASRELGLDEGEGWPEISLRVGNLLPPVADGVPEVRNSDAGVLRASRIFVVRNLRERYFEIDSGLFSQATHPERPPRPSC